MLSARKNGNCNPIVYYSTLEKDQFTKELFDIDAHPEIWTNVPPENLADVTAVAVDCRHTDSTDPKNNTFTLGRMKGLDFTIKMLSPSDKELADKYTYNEAVIKGWNHEIASNVESSARTSVQLRYTPPKFVKSAFPTSGTEQNPEGVVVNSVLDYVLKVTNPDPEISMDKIVVRDVFPIALKTNQTIKARFDKGENIPVDQSARVSASITAGKSDESLEQNDIRIVEVTIDTLDPGGSVEITIPVQVTADIGTKITNKAEIVSINGAEFKPEDIIDSNLTYHKVTGVQAKIQKVDGAGNPLSGATLQILDRDNCDASGNPQPIELFTDDPDNPGTQISHDYSYVTDENVWKFNVPRGNYILRELSVPEGYKKSDDIPFEIDIEGVLKQDGKPVTYVTMVNEPEYKIVFHVNNYKIDEDNFKIVQNVDEDFINNGKKVPKFDEIPEIEGNRFTSFTGWYTEMEGGERITFNESYDGVSGNPVTQNGVKIYNIYAHWQDYKVIFHEKNPSDVNAEFRTYENKEKSAFSDPSKHYLDKEFKIEHFYDIPAFAEDDYVFAGWYHNSDYSKVPDPDSVTMSPADFEKDCYLKRDGLSDPDYHLYARWIPVGWVSRNTKYDKNDLTGGQNAQYRGFGLEGVQIRPKDMSDPNIHYNEDDQSLVREVYPEGLRFVTSLRESLIDEIKSIDRIEGSDPLIYSFGVEYGYVVGTEDNITSFYNHYKNPANYKLQYKGDNVNGKDTTGGALTTDTDFRYITNVNCTSQKKAARKRMLLLKKTTATSKITVCIRW